MLNKKNTRRALLAEINVVPYIDVMLVLLVIFMIATPLLTQGVTVSLPQASAKVLPPQKEDPLIVSIDEKGLIYLNLEKNPTAPINSQDLLTRIAAQLQIDQQNHVTRGVYVKGDRHIDYDKIMQVMVLLQKSGVENIGLMTESEVDSQK